MDEQIIIGLFTIGGTLVGGLIGGLFSVKAAKIGYKKESMEKDIRKLANQVKSYWLLEKEYLSQLSKAVGKSEEALMRQTRKIVENNGNDYPNMTAADANTILQKYD